MNKLRDKLIRFMYGRNGVDALNKFIFFLNIVAFIVYLFIQHESILIIQGVLLIIYIFRTFSKQLYLRQKENQIFLNIVTAIKRPFLRLYNRIRDRKTHVFKKCPNCKRILKLRKIKGSHKVKCPVCSHHFDVKI